MKIATVLLSSEPVSMIRRHNGMISVVRRKLITSDESFLTRAPMTPREVNRRYSNGLDLDVVLRKGYKKSGICAVACQLEFLGRRARHTIKEECSGLIVRCHALQERQRITDAVRSCCREL
jgi:hypothetical protein